MSIRTDQGVTMRNEAVDSFLQALAARVPAPGGGATAALHARRPDDQATCDAAIRRRTLGTAPRVEEEAAK